MVQSKEINFDGQNIYIGIDVHLKTWNVTIITQSGYKKKRNMGFAQPMCRSRRDRFFHLSRYDLRTRHQSCD